MRSKNNSAAIKVYDKIESKFGLTEELIGKKHSLYLGLGKQKKATRELQKLTNAFPSNLEYQHMLASHFQRIGEDKKAKEIFQKNKLSRTALARILPYVKDILNDQNKITDAKKRNKYIIQTSDLKLLSILAEKEGGQ